MGIKESVMTPGLPNSMNTEPLVSILIPFYQVAHYIERCARSVLEQTYRNIEFIFLNDCSSDNSLPCLKQTIEEYPARNDQVRVISNPRNMGLAYSRNRCIELCTGSFVFWVDADDFISTDAIQKLVEKQRETGADIVTGRAVTLSQEGMQEIPFSSHSSKQETLTGLLDFSIKTMVWGRLIRTALYRDHSIQCIEGVNFREDFQVLPRLFYYADTAADIEDVIYYYEQGNNASYNSLARDYIEVKLKKDLQDLESTRLIRDFFKEKEPKYNQLNEEHIVYYLREILRDTTRSGNKALFLKTLDELKRCDNRIALKYAASLLRVGRISPGLCWIIKRLRFILLEPKSRRSYA